jgi:uncharacterized protein YndB with AHSA1/START domain
MKQIPSAPEIAVISGDFEQFTPSELFAFFTQADKLVQWWPQTAETDPQIGGAFRLSWPDNDWHLRGQYTALEPGLHVGFTWAWDHEPSAGTLKQVDIWFQPLFETGSRLAVYHGPYEATESDQAAKQGVIEGWIHFGMILAGLRRGATEE